MTEKGQQLNKRPQRSIPNSYGSEWQRWDLHIHTPGTQRNDQFSGNSIEEKWNQFYSAINNYIGDGSDPKKAIAVIGITDYLSIENYRKVVDDRRLPENILVLPNIEMRIQPTATNAPINIHFIFNPEFIDQVESRFFARLSFKTPNTTYHANKSDLILLGKQSDSSLNDNEAYKMGALQFVPSLSEVIEVFSGEPLLRENVLIFVSNSSGDGVSGAVNHADYLTNEGKSQLTEFRRSVYTFVDGIFSANKGDIEYFLGKKNNCPKEVVIENCGSLKPCVHGSDAHQNDKIFSPDLDRFCWIKAEPTFNGLKQIMFEPEERVRISPLKPETKENYLVIDRLEFADDDFQTEPIYFSDKLTCIIGGKSTGKSILLHNLALALDKKQVEDKDRTSQTRTKTDIALKVYWADEKEGDINLDRKIIYIPQSYLNRLCDTQTEKTEIDNIIQGIILLNNDAKASFDKADITIKNYKPELEKTILDLIATHNAIVEIQEKIKEIGDKVGVEAELKKLTEEKERLAKTSDLKEEEIKEYQEALKLISILTNKTNEIQNDINNIVSLNSLIKSEQIPSFFSEQTKETISVVQKTIVKEANLKWKIKCDELITNLNSEKKHIEELKTTYQTKEEELKPKIQSNTAIAELTQKIKTQSDKLNSIETLSRQLEGKNNEKNLYINQSIESIDLYKEYHQIFAESVNNNANLKTKDLNFSVEVPFKNEAFIEKLKRIMDVGRTNFRTIVSPDTFTSETYTSDYIYKIINNLLTNNLILKNGNDAESAIRDILSDWYEVKYKVTMGEDSIDTMSPGKKALVLLKLLIELAESHCPILIDQPEDDLDNRSIFNELISFIKKKKKDRQIIVVTHNANIVLGADAEQVIVANQRGNNAPNRKKRFEYRSGAIENNTPLKEMGKLAEGILNEQGIQQHICEVLEGGEKAFELRKQKYRI